MIPNTYLIGINQIVDSCIQLSLGCCFNFKSYIYISTMVANFSI